MRMLDLEAKENANLSGFRKINNRQESRREGGKNNK
jgi:hypothetical protein